jgi:hypothetical protein
MIVVALLLASSSYTEVMKRDVPAAQATVTSPWVKDVLAKAAELPPRSPRTVWRNKGKNAALTDAQYNALTADEKATFTKEVEDDEVYYAKYSSPLAYARALDLAAKHGVDGIKGKSVVDFGYGDIGQLQMMARSGAEAVGVDVNSLLPALYAEPGDTGELGNGKVRIVDGRWPASEKTKALVGGPFDLFLSKNTLKRGYVHPQEKADPKMLIDLGVDDDAFLQAMHAAVKKDGLVVIYNLCPAPAAAGKPFLPWSDGHSPFTEAQWKKHGFDVVAFDVDDTESARKLAHALKWNEGDDGMDIEHDLFAWYTLLKRR